jgi:hypothetical protein
MKILPVGVAAAIAAALLGAAPAYADDPTPPPGPPGVVAPDHDYYSVRTPDGGQYQVSLAPDQPIPDNMDDPDEIVFFAW